MSLYLAVTPMVLYICYVSQLDFALFGGVRASRLDPEEPFGGDEREGLVERHDDRPEVAGRAPSVPAPPGDLDTITIAGRPQPRHGPARASAVERVTAARPHHLHPAAREVVRRDALAYRIGPTGSREGLPRRRFAPSVTPEQAEAQVDAAARLRGAGRSAAPVRDLLHRRDPAPRAGPGRRRPAGAGAAHRRRRPARHGPGPDGELRRLPPRPEHRPLVGPGRGPPPAPRARRH